MTEDMHEVCTKESLKMPPHTSIDSFASHEIAVTGVKRKIEDESSSGPNKRKSDGVSHVEDKDIALSAPSCLKEPVVTTAAAPLPTSPVKLGPEDLCPAEDSRAGLHAGQELYLPVKSPACHSVLGATNSLQPDNEEAGLLEVVSDDEDKENKIEAPTKEAVSSTFDSILAKTLLAAKLPEKRAVESAMAVNNGNANVTIVEAASPVSVVDDEGPKVIVEKQELLVPGQSDQLVTAAVHLDAEYKADAAAAKDKVCSPQTTRKLEEASKVSHEDEDDGDLDDMDDEEMESGDSEDEDHSGNMYSAAATNLTTASQRQQPSSGQSSPLERYWPASTGNLHQHHYGQHVGIAHSTPSSSSSLVVSEAAGSTMDSLAIMSGLEACAANSGSSVMNATPASQHQHLQHHMPLSSTAPTAIAVGQDNGNMMLTPPNTTSCDQQQQQVPVSGSEGHAVASNTYHFLDETNHPRIECDENGKSYLQLGTVTHHQQHQHHQTQLHHHAHAHMSPQQGDLIHLHQQQHSQPLHHHLPVTPVLQPKPSNNSLLINHHHQQRFGGGGGRHFFNNNRAPSPIFGGNGRDLHQQHFALRSAVGGQHQSAWSQCSCNNNNRGLGNNSLKFSGMAGRRPLTGMGEADMDDDDDDDDEDEDDDDDEEVASDEEDMEVVNRGRSPLVPKRGSCSPCYRQHRSEVLNLSLHKLHIARQRSDSFLRRSVLICNMLRFIEEESSLEDHREHQQQQHQALFGASSGLELNSPASLGGINSEEEQQLSNGGAPNYIGWSAHQHELGLNNGLHHQQQQVAVANSFGEQQHHHHLMHHHHHGHQSSPPLTPNPYRDMCYGGPSIECPTTSAATSVSSGINSVGFIGTGEEPNSSDPTANGSSHGGGVSALGPLKDFNSAFRQTPMPSPEHHHDGSGDMLVSGAGDVIGPASVNSIGSVSSTVTSCVPSAVTSAVNNGLVSLSVSSSVIINHAADGSQFGSPQHLSTAPSSADGVLLEDASSSPVHPVIIGSSDHHMVESITANPNPSDVSATGSSGSSNQANVAEVGQQQQQQDEEEDDANCSNAVCSVGLSVAGCSSYTTTSTITTTSDCDINWSRVLSLSSQSGVEMVEHQHQLTTLSSSSTCNSSSAAATMTTTAPTTLSDNHLHHSSGGSNSSVIGTLTADSGSQQQQSTIVSFTTHGVEEGSVAPSSLGGCNLWPLTSAANHHDQSSMDSDASMNGLHLGHNNNNNSHHHGFVVGGSRGGMGHEASVDFSAPTIHTFDDISWKLSPISTEEVMKGFPDDNMFQCAA